MKSNIFMTLSGSLMLVFSIGTSLTVLAHSDEKHKSVPAVFIGIDSAPGKVVKQFHQALKAGDEATIRKVLAEDVLIYEGGKAERSLTDYASHHMHADMAYLNGLSVTPKEHHVRLMEDVAVSTSITHFSGEYKGKEVDSTAMETLVLAKQSDGNWKVIHIHWS